MELLVVALALALFEFAAWRWGADSRSVEKGRLGAGGLLPQDGDAPAGSGGDQWPGGGYRSRLQAPTHRVTAPA